MTQHTMTVRHSDAEYRAYCETRFARSAGRGEPFWWAGHMWKYEHTSFDDQGKYDVLWRPVALEEAEVVFTSICSGGVDRIVGLDDRGQLWAANFSDPELVWRKIRSPFVCQRQEKVS